jgi:hypothetical protein
MGLQRVGEWREDVSVVLREWPWMDRDARNEAREREKEGIWPWPAVEQNTTHGRGSTRQGNVLSGEAHVER